MYKENLFIIEATNRIFYHALAEAILYQGKPKDLSNTLINSQYLEKLVCQVLVLQGIVILRVLPCDVH